ncbi:hypothetical protein GCM10009814_21760 [Lapillicoccus jejuensis]
MRARDGASVPAAAGAGVVGSAPSEGGLAGSSTSCCVERSRTSAPAATGPAGAAAGSSGVRVRRARSPLARRAPAAKASRRGGAADGVADGVAGGAAGGVEALAGAFVAAAFVVAPFPLVAAFVAEVLVVEAERAVAPEPAAISRSSRG